MSGCRREVHMPAEPFGEPVADQFGLMARRIVHDDVNVEIGGHMQPRMPERLDDEELADWRTGRNAVSQLAALTIGARLAVADA